MLLKSGSQEDNEMETEIFITKYLSCINAAANVQFAPNRFEKFSYLCAIDIYNG